MKQTSTLLSLSQRLTQIMRDNERRASSKILRSLFVIICLYCLSGKHAALAQWSTNPAVNNAITTAVFEQSSTVIASDGSGGAIIAWYDRRNGSDYDIYAQRINAAGVVQWTADGLVICNETNNQSISDIVSDGAGGAIITWSDFRNGIDANVYAQRINAAGVAQWTANGVAICTAFNNQGGAKIVSDGAGGAIIIWGDNRNGTNKGSNTDIYAQRINAAGITQWTTDGVPVCSQPATQQYIAITTDGAGGAIVAWTDERNSNDDDVYAQRIDSSGITQWATDGEIICTAANKQLFPLIVSNGAGGAIITWNDNRSGNDFDVYAQQINAAGVVGWTADGVAISAAIDDQFHPTIASDGSGGAIITWDDNRNSGSSIWDIYAQRINAAGVPVWTTDGEAICTEADEQRLPTIASDGSGGAVITWYDSRSGTPDIYAQQVNAAGAVGWTVNGVAISTAAHEQFSPVILSSGAGGAIITWTDFRDVATNDADIYAQKVNADGTIGGCIAPSITDQPLITQSICQNAVPTNLAVTATGDGLTYQWYSNTTNSNNGATIISGETNNSFTPSTTMAGTFYYYAEVTNDCGMGASNLSTVIVNPSPTVTSTQTDVQCSGSSNGAIDITVTGGTSPYTYEWTGTGVNAIAEDQTGLTEGTYNVIVTDAGGCTASDTVVIINAGLTVNAGTDKDLCDGPVTLAAIISGAVTSGPPPPAPFAEGSGSTADKRIFIGNIDYLTIGNTFSQSEDRNNCNKNATSSQTLTLPAGAVVKKAYLYWSGSGLLDNQVKLNGTSVTAENTKTYNRAIVFNYFAARKDVTSMVSASGTYTVSDLNWSNGFPYCFDNSAYGGWALIVIYEQASLPTSKIHVNTEKFQFTYPAGNYSTTINDINVPAGCSSNAKFSIVAFEGDNYIGEGLTIGGQNFGDNNFRGQSGPNLDILSWNISTLVTSGSSSLTYSINTYLSNTVFGPAIDGLFDYVKVLKYNTCPPGCSSVSYQWTFNGDSTVGTTQSITVSQPGTYVVKAIDCSGCIATDTVVVSNCPPGGPNKSVGISKLIVSKKEVTKSDIAITVQPNPGISYFNLTIKSGDNIRPVSVRILNVYGKVMSVYQKVEVNSTLRIGSDKWVGGIYFAEVIQGGERKVVKLIRMN